ncbi:MAG: hypothetical protein KDM63_16350, partial [Verrucomicrobiae bacterium]|nr:hypothetical protein [Verrucomicrobiae bacterium]
LFLAVVVLAVWPDEELGDESAVMPEWRGLGENNPLGEFQAWLEAHPFTGEDDRLRMLRKGREWDAEAADAILREEAEVLAKFKELLAHADEEWEWREGEDLAVFGRQMPYLKPIQGAASLLAIDSVRMAERGDPAGGLLAANHVINGSGRLASARGSLIHLMVSASIEKETLSAMRRIARNHRFEKEPVRSVIEDLGNYPVPVEPLRFGFQAEYLMFKNLIQGLGTDDSKKWGNPLPGVERFAFFLQPNTTINLRRRFLEPELDAIGKGWSPLNLTFKREIEQIREVQRHFPLSVIGPNPIGESAISVVPVGQSVTGSVFDTVALHRLTGVFLALRLFEIDHGKLPAKLDELVPAYLSQLPADPYSEENALLWNPAEGILYSVGRDGIDNGGAIRIKPREANSDVGISWGGNDEALKEQE